MAVKCTFDIKSDGTTEVAAKQPPVVVAPEYLDPDNPGKSSLKYDLDLVRTKVTTDVLVLGHAHAPNGRPTTEMDVGFRVGPITKRLHVVGDRIWRGSTASPPEPFVMMPIVWERAFGGYDPVRRDTPNPDWDLRNPVGIGFANSESGANGLRLPNIEYPDQGLRRWNDRPLPAGFGPLCAHWQSRAQFAGTCDEQWQRTRLPLLPDDFDDRHYQCAPSDQQPPEFLRGGEPVVLTNLSPAGEVRFELPRVYLGLETFFVTGERRHHQKPSLHTVIIEPELSRLSLVWHSALPCHPQVYKLEKTRIVAKRLVRLAHREEYLEEDA